MLVSIPPKLSASSFMGYFKGKSALMMFDEHVNLKYKFCNRRFWSEDYYVSTIGPTRSRLPSTSGSRRPTTSRSTG